MHKPHLAESYHKELIATLQAKGKIPRQMTVADERRANENANTAPRIFPGPLGKEAALDGMLRRAEAQVEAAAAAGRAQGQQGQAQAQARERRKRDPEERKRIEARLGQLEAELAAERALRRGLEGEMAEVRESLSRPGTGAGVGMGGGLSRPGTGALSGR
ncbi:hypothetical protein HYH03_017207 [Edaphochlamys debaryana]|uniref:Uncharacterized protein n=1 Tax=Edaphochlamys debaryana TaxID=47281 RepID=A0A835XG39_9CHLO|nr:hypothetical protein HYH03_017207 [Edaphochlamys debaryana]|eukprot:KAG2483962.1 hypothetical protein HYH03_017207 [Edaphochlamys debaryana]